MENLKNRWRINWDAVFTLVAWMMVYAIVAAIVYFTLVGVKYSFDPVVHIGIVDWIVCTIIPYYIVRWMNHIDQKMRKESVQA